MLKFIRVHCIVCIVPTLLIVGISLLQANKSLKMCPCKTVHSRPVSWSFQSCMNVVHHGLSLKAKYWVILHFNFQN